MKNEKWICINAHDWKGSYEETIPVMYHGVDWQQCPICGAPVVPVCGSNQPINKKLQINTNSSFCQCGQVKHVGFDECIDCLDAHD